MNLVSTFKIELMADHWLETAPDSEPYIFHNRNRNVMEDVFSAHESNGATSGNRKGGSSFLRMLERSNHLPRTPQRRETGPRLSPASSSMLQGFSPVTRTPENITTDTRLPPSERLDFTRNSHQKPPLHATKEIALLSTASVLPDRLRSFFPFQYFNAMQSEAFSQIYDSDQNVVLSAPTASGKTTCFDMAIARLMHQEVETKSFKVLPRLSKKLTLQVVYIGPTKSLCQQRARDWNERLSRFSMRCTHMIYFSSSDVRRRIDRG